MRILHVISSINPKSGGPIEGVKQLHDPMRALGVKVEVACCDSSDAPWLANSGLSVIHSLGPGKGNYGYTSRLLPWLRENARHFDAVIVEGLWQYHGFAVRQALAGTRVPYFVFTHGMLDPWFKRNYPLKHLKKWLYWPWGEYRVLRDARAVIFTCEEERLLARQSFWLYKANETITHYGTKTPPQDAAYLSALFLEQFPACRGKRIALFLSRIHAKKGCDLLIEAFATAVARNPLLHLVMAGPDQTGWAAELKVQAKRLGLIGDVTWTGMIEGDLKWGAFHACEVFCLPSHTENFGIVVAEALACGKPVLISNKVNIWREIAQHRAGFIANDDLSSTIDSMENWLALSPEEYTAMSVRAGQCFQNKFHIRRAAERLVEIISMHQSIN